MGTQASWFLDLPSAPSAPGEERPGSPSLDFLGFGVVQPLERAQSDFKTASGEAIVKAAVEQILMTRAGSPSSPAFVQGELPWDSSFGSMLYVLLYRNNDPLLSELAAAYVQDALERNEPRVRLRVVRAYRDQLDPTVLRVRLNYDIIHRQVTGNLVVIPNVSQEVLLS